MEVFCWTQYFLKSLNINLIKTSNMLNPLFCAKFNDIRVWRIMLPQVSDKGSRKTEHLFITGHGDDTCHPSTEEAKSGG